MSVWRCQPFFNLVSLVVGIKLYELLALEVCEVFSHNFIKCTFNFFFFLFSFWVPVMWMLVHLMLSQRSQLLSFFHLIFLLLFWLVSIILSFRSLTHFLHQVVIYSIVCLFPHFSHWVLQFLLFRCFFRVPNSC